MYVTQLIGTSLIKREDGQPRLGRRSLSIIQTQCVHN